MGLQRNKKKWKEQNLEPPGEQPVSNIPVFDLRDFSYLLAVNLGTHSQLADSMILLHSRYQFCIGMIPESNWPDFFDNVIDGRKHDFAKHYEYGNSCLSTFHTTAWFGR